MEPTYGQIKKTLLGMVSPDPPGPVFGLKDGRMSAGIALRYQDGAESPLVLRVIATGPALLVRLQWAGTSTEVRTITIKWCGEWESMLRDACHRQRHLGAQVIERKRAKADHTAMPPLMVIDDEDAS